MCIRDRNRTLLILSVHMIAVEIAQRLVEGDGIEEHLKAVVEIVHIRYEMCIRDRPDSDHVLY